MAATAAISCSHADSSVHRTGVISAPSPAYYVVAGGRANRQPGKTRVLFVGDSITGQVLVDGQGQALFEHAGFDVQRSTRSGFGLLDDPQHGYSRDMAMRVSSFDPDVVVVEFIGNYRAFDDPGLRGVAVNTPRFYAAWQREAGDLTTQAAARGAQVFWVLGPTVGISQSWADRVHEIAQGYLRLSTTHPRTGYIDAFSALGDPWRPAPTRSPDGVHLTATGGATLAHAIFDRVVVMRGISN